MSMKANLSEDYMVEQAAINWLKGLGYSHIHGSELSTSCQNKRVIK